MLTRVVATAAAAWLAAGSWACADTITDSFTGSYTAVDTGTGNLLPTINDDGYSFLPSPFAGTLTVGSPTTPTTFLQVAPINGGSGTVTGSIAIAMTLMDENSAVTGVTSSVGGNTATLVNGAIDFSANYGIFYSSQTDCLTWDAASCTPSGNTTTIGDTLTVTFADDAVLAINLYNWSDWDMAPDISFNLISGPGTPVPEPASLAIFGIALAGVYFARRHLQTNRLPALVA